MQLKGLKWEKLIIHLFPLCSLPTSFFGMTSVFCHDTFTYLFFKVQLPTVWIVPTCKNLQTRITVHIAFSEKCWFHVCKFIVCQIDSWFPLWKDVLLIWTFTFRWWNTKAFSSSFSSDKTHSLLFLPWLQSSPVITVLPFYFFKYQH